MIPIVLIGILVFAGALTVVAWDDRVLLVGLSLHSIVMAMLALNSAGPVMPGAVFVGNATAVAVLGMGYLYAAGGEENAALLAERARRRRRLRRYAAELRGGSNAFLQGLSALLAIVVALGLANKPIAGLSEAAIGVPSFIAYWMLAAGLVIIVLNREYLKVGAGLLLMLNGGQVLYLMAAGNLEARLIAASVLIVLALALGVSYLVVVASRLRAQGEPAEPAADSADYLEQDGLEQENLATGVAYTFDQPEDPTGSAGGAEQGEAASHAAVDCTTIDLAVLPAQEKEQC